MKMTSKKKRILLFSATAVVALAVPSVALTLNAYSLETKVSSANKTANGTISNDFIKNLNREQILKNINYDSSGKLTPLKLIGSDGKVYQPNTELIPKEIDNKDILLKSRDNVLNTPDSLNEYNKTNESVKNAFISNLPKELVGKQITLDENSAKFLNSFLGTSFKTNEKFEFTDLVGNMYDTASQNAFNQEITINDVASASTIIGLDLNKEMDSLKSNPDAFASSFNNLINTNLNSGSLKVVSVNRQFGAGASNPKSSLPSTSDVNKNKPSAADVSTSHSKIWLLVSLQT